MAEPTRRELPELGPRGEGWVALQVVILALVGVVGVVGPRWPGGLDRWTWTGVALCVAGGAVLLIGGAFRLGAQLTPFPKPVEGGELKDRGVYGLVRHPLYGGGVLVSTAYSLASSPLALAATALLAVLFELKRRREEAWLVEHHPGYEDYRRRVHRRFIPFVW